MTESAAKRRRKSEDERKRSRQSCDLCKKHRCKCIKIPDSDICEACAKGRKACTWTAPTKTRFYGSLEDLSDRYRCMEAVLQGAFPDATFTTAADVRSFGERMGFPMPDSHDSSGTLADLVKTDQNTHTNANRPFSRRYANPGQESNSTDDEVSNQAPRLVSDPYGGKHYIGPTGSLSFLAEVQGLVSSYDGHGRSSVESSSSFTLDNVAKALETEGVEEEHVDKTASAEQVAASVPSPLSITSGISHITSVPDLDNVLQSLPPPNIMDPRITAYFDHIHADFPLFHRATFQDGYETFVLKPLRQRSRSQSHQGLAQSVQTPLPRADWGWFVCLNMILCFGSLSDSRITDCPNLHHKMSYLSFSLLPHLTTKCSLSNVQALFLLSLYAHNNNERNTAWVLVGTATRMSFALGLHQNVLDALYRPVERETRKRVWCTLYAFEQFLCSTLGRPSGIGDTDVEVRIPAEGLLDDANGAGGDFQQHSLRLNQLLATARRLSIPKRRKPAAKPTVNLTSPNSASSLALDEPSPVTTMHDLLEELYKWKADLPPHLQMPALAVGSETLAAHSSIEQLKLSLCRQNPRQIRALILLHIQYHYIIILMTRSFLLQDIPNNNSQQAQSSSNEDNALQNITSPTTRGRDTQTSKRLASVAVNSASQSAILTLALHELSVLNGVSGLDIFYAYSAAMVLLLWMLRSENFSTTMPGTNSKEDANPRVQELITRLQEAIKSVKKSKTMSRFANVVDKFAGVVETIRKGGSHETRTRDRPQVHRLNSQTVDPVAMSTPGNFSTTPAQAGDGNLPPSSFSHPSHTSMNGTAFVSGQPLHSTDYAGPSSVHHAYDQTTDRTAAPSLWPSLHPPPSSNLMPDNFVTFNGDVGDPSHIAQNYYDPLGALANGYIVNWDDLDAFVAGMKE